MRRRNFPLADFLDHGLDTVLEAAAGAVVLGVSHHTGIELNWAIHNASITRLIYSAEKVSLSMFNGLPHLDRDGKRQLITYR